MYPVEPGNAALLLAAALVAELSVTHKDLASRVEARLRSSAKAADDSRASHLHHAADTIAGI